LTWLVAVNTVLALPRSLWWTNEKTNGRKDERTGREQCLRRV